MATRTVRQDTAIDARNYTSPRVYDGIRVLTGTDKAKQVDRVRKALAKQKAK